jgi:hypothetical protein
MHFGLLAWEMLMFATVLFNAILIVNKAVQVMVCGSTDACIAPAVVAGFARY